MTSITSKETTTVCLVATPRVDQLQLRLRTAHADHRDLQLRPASARAPRSRFGTCEAAGCGDGFVRAGVEACDDGNLANLGDDPDELPRLIADTPADEPGAGVVKVVGGGAHTCVLLEGEQMRCWGCNHFGVIGLPFVDGAGDVRGAAVRAAGDGAAGLRYDLRSLPGARHAARVMPVVTGAA